MEVIWLYRRAFSLRQSSCIGLIGPYMVVIALSPQLGDGTHKVEPFVRACQALTEHAVNLPVASYILAMLKALEMEHHFRFPDEARLVLQESDLQPEELEDIPMEMKIPIARRPRGRQGLPHPPGTVTSETVGELLARWVCPSTEDPE